MKITTRRDALFGQLQTVTRAASTRSAVQALSGVQLLASQGEIELRATAMEGANGSTLQEVERDYILRVFRETGGVVSTAATRLGIPRTTLNAMMKKLGVNNVAGLTQLALSTGLTQLQRSHAASSESY